MLGREFEYAAKRIKKGSKFKIWQDGYHPIHLSSPKMIEQRLDYIHKNPVEEGYVYEPAEYIFSSARDYPLARFCKACFFPFRICNTKS